MRPWLTAISVSVLLTFASTTFAAPTCENRDGAATRCGTAGAMPVGWTLPPAERAAHDTPDPPLSQMLLPLFLICGLFGLISAMPDFDGWDASEEDSEAARMIKPRRPF
jgi:hypothetical protein